MRSNSRTWRLVQISVAVVALSATVAKAQVTPAAGSTPPDDKPSVKVGGTIYADYTYQESPDAKDADGNTINNSSFNVSRAYINITGQLNHRWAFRITPDIARETGTGSSLSGSQDFRLKYAFGQFNLDDWTNKGSWVRFGLQQTPYVDFEEGVYRYRWQGSIFTDREGYLTSSDNGLSAKWVFGGNYGEVQGGFYNGDGYSKAEANDQKAFQIRATVRPLPLGGVWKGLRLTGFWDEDHYVQDAKRQRGLVLVTFEHPWVNVGAQYLSSNDQNASAAKPQVKGEGYSIWVTPRFGASGWELLLRHDDLKPNKDVDQTKKRDIVGVAYWIQGLEKVQAAVMVDYDSLKQDGFTPDRPDDTRYGLKMMINF